MKWFVLGGNRKISAWALGAILLLALVGCVSSNSSVSGLPEAEDRLDVEVLAGQVHVGDIASGQLATAGETILLAKGRQLSNEGAGRVELAVAGDTRFWLAPDAVIELTDYELGNFVFFRQVNGGVTYGTGTTHLTVTGSTGLAFGPDGLERVRFLAEAMTEASLFVVNIEPSSINITVEEGGTAVNIDDEEYQLRQGESLNVDSLDRLEISRALAVQSRPGSGVAEAETSNQLPGRDGHLDTPSQPAEEKTKGGLGAIAEAETTSEVTGVVSNIQPLRSGDLSSSEKTAPVLVAPPDYARLSTMEVIKLSWRTEAALDSGTWFELQLWREGEPPFGMVTMIAETEWQPSSMLEPGEYQWQVRLLRLSDRQYLSSASSIGHFEVIDPTAAPTQTPTSSPTTEPTSTPTASVPETPTPVVGQASYPQPVLTAPNSDKVFAFEEPVVLQWRTVGALGDNQWYEVRLWRNGTEWAGAVKVKEPQWKVAEAYNPGRFGWRVAVINAENGEWTGDISPESDTRFFVWNAPIPDDGGGDDDGGGGGSQPPSSR